MDPHSSGACHTILLKHDHGYPPVSWPVQDAHYSWFQPIPLFPQVEVRAQQHFVPRGKAGLSSQTLLAEEEAQQSRETDTIMFNNLTQFTQYLLTLLSSGTHIFAKGAVILQGQVRHCVPRFRCPLYHPRYSEGIKALSYLSGVAQCKLSYFSKCLCVVSQPAHILRGPAFTVSVICSYF